MKKIFKIPGIFRLKTIKAKILAVDIILFGICMVIIIMLFNRKYTEILTEHAEKSAQEDLKLVAGNLSRHVKEMDYLSDIVFYDTFTCGLLRNLPSATDIEQIQMYYDYLPHVTDMSKVANDITIRIYTDSAIFLSLEGKYLFGEDLIREEAWYFEVNNANGSPVFVYDPVKNECMFLRVLKDVNYNYARLGVLSISINASAFDTLLSEKEGQTIALFDKNGNVVSAMVKDTAPETLERLFNSVTNPENDKKVLLGNRDLYVISEEIENTGLILVSGTDYRVITGEADRLAGMSLTIALFVFILSVSACILSMRSVTKRINVLGRKMITVEKDNFNSLIEITHEDELVTIEEQYNRMCERIRLLIDEVYKAEIQKRESELRVLQAQVNPHFLYNAFDTINWMAIDSDNYEISEMVTKLGKFFRVSLSDGRSVISLDEEIQLVSLYLDIQKARFGEYLSCGYDIDDGIKNCRCLKLLLQPIVENSIKHGFRKDELKNGVIKISASLKKNRITVDISDNGAGIDGTYDLRHIEDTPLSGYGLHNVRDRLKAYYREDYRFTISGKVNEGAVVHIEWPADEGEELNAEEAE